VRGEGTTFEIRRKRKNRAKKRYKCLVRRKYPLGRETLDCLLLKRKGKKGRHGRERGGRDVLVNRKREAQRNPTSFSKRK